MNLKYCIKRSLEPVDADRRAAFEDQLDRTLRQGLNAAIRYDLPYPKYEFLNYLCDEKGLVGHGSSRSDLITLEPVRCSEDVSEFGNRRQVFSSADGIWAMWFVILDKTKLRFGTINGCFTLLFDAIPMDHPEEVRDFQPATCRDDISTCLPTFFILNPFENQLISHPS